MASSSDFAEVYVIDDTGREVRIDLLIQRIITIRAHCGCFKHPDALFEVLVTHGGAYIRKAITAWPPRRTQLFFRALDQSGPIVASIDCQEKYNV